LSCVEIEGGWGCFVAGKFYKEEVKMEEGERRVEC
jgi:SRSO17 transposase